MKDLLLTLNQDAGRLVALLSGHADRIGTVSDAEWERLIALARKNGVAQMLYTALKAQEVTPPPQAASVIRSIHLASAVHGTKQFHELEKIVQVLHRAGIPVVPVKGAWLGEAVYGNIALRGMTDLDLWVKRNQVDEACRVMVSLGYSLGASRPDRPQPLQDELLAEKKLCKIGVPIVELHWALFVGEWLRHTARIDEELVWQRTCSYKGEMLRQLCAEDAIIHIGVHLAVNHQISLSGFRALLDLDRARQKISVDWGVVASRAKEWRVATSMWIVLLMLAQLFGDTEKKLPLSELEPSWFHQWLLTRFVSPQSILDAHEITGLRRFFFLLALVDKPAGVMNLVWRTLVPDRTWLILRYGLQEAPFWRVLLQRLWHPLRLVLKKEI